MKTTLPNRIELAYREFRDALNITPPPEYLFGVEHRAAGEIFRGRYGHLPAPAARPERQGNHTRATERRNRP